MKKRFCGVDLGKILESLRPLDDIRKTAIHALEETLTEALPFHVARDDGAAASKFSLLILGCLGKGIHFASIDGPKGLHAETRDIPIILMRRAVAAIPEGRIGAGQMGRVLASPHGTAGMLIVAQTRKGAMNCGFARNPALEKDDASYLLKAYFTEIVSSWTDKH